MIQRDTVLPWTDLTIDRARSKLSGYHFSKESLSDGERDILYIAEALLRLLDEVAEREDERRQSAMEESERGD